MKVMNQRGVVSLLAVSLMSILILILTVGMVRLMAGELHQATDSADSVEAYYTAQGAAEDAAQQLRTKLEVTPPDQISTLDQGCVPPAIPPYLQPTETAGQALDCVQVAANLNTVTSTVDENATRTFDLTNSILTANGYITRLVLSWDDNTSSAGGSFTSGTDATGTTWLCGGVSPPPGCTNQPPVMKVGVTNYYPGQNTNVDTQYSGELILSPDCTASGCPAPGSTPKFVYDCHLPNSLPPAVTASCTGSDAPPGNPLIQVQCSGGAAQRCTAEIDNLVPTQTAQYRTVVTLTPLFHAAQFSLSAYALNPASNNPPVSGIACTQSDGTTNSAAADCLAPIALDDAQVDVTATVGNTERRVELEVPVRAAQSLGKVIEGDSDVCKSFDVLSNGSGFYQISQPTGTSIQPPCAIANNP